MSFILPTLYSFVLFGSTFDLRRYDLTPFTIYNNSDISRYAEVTNINSYKSEFFVVDKPSEFREALGIDVATSLKAMVNNFPYYFHGHLDSAWSDENDVRVVLKLCMRTVNESLPYNVPTIGDWKTKGPQRVGSHYIKSIAYGADFFIILSIMGQNEQHKDNIRRTVSSRLGKAGILDSSFKENFDAILKEHEARYMMSSVGTVPIGKYTPPRDIEDVLIVKDNFQEIVRKASNNKGFRISYEMESLSLLDPGFPLVEINSKILTVLETVELKYEDLVVAHGEYLSWANDATLKFTPELEAQIEDFDIAVNNARTAMEVAISNMDVTTTSGNIDQFEDAFNAYGERLSNTKYRNWLNQLKQNVESLN